MTRPTALFWDVGGVLLTNGWDQDSRRRMAAQFDINWDEFAERHELLAQKLDTGKLSLDQYLSQTVFYRKRDFSPAAVREFMLAESKPFPDRLALLARIARQGKYLLATLNNESTELNLYRIERFGLRSYFTIFFSSCFLGVRKPDEGIYRQALAMTQRPPEQCVFIDDRPLNVEQACRCGLRGIQFKSATQLETDLRQAGVEF